MKSPEVQRLNNYNFNAITKNIDWRKKNPFHPEGHFYDPHPYFNHLIRSQFAVEHAIEYWSQVSIDKSCKGLVGSAIYGIVHLPIWRKSGSRGLKECSEHMRIAKLCQRALKEHIKPRVIRNRPAETETRNRIRNYWTQQAFPLNLMLSPDQINRLEINKLSDHISNIVEMIDEEISLIRSGNDRASWTTLVVREAYAFLSRKKISIGADKKYKPSGEYCSCVADVFMIVGLKNDPMTYVRNIETHLGDVAWSKRQAEIHNLLRKLIVHPKPLI